MKTPTLFFNLFFVLSLLLAVPVMAQSSDSTRAVSVSRIKGAVNVDGVLDENEWKSADSIAHFIQVEPFQGSPSRNLTVVKILTNDKGLYFGVYCYDSLGKSAIRVPDMKRDFDWRAHDTFAICLDGFLDKRNSQSFVTNPYGAQKDYLSFDAILFDGDWNGLWKVRTSITGAGWFAEFQIPWKTLRYAPGNDVTQLWGVNFLRLRRASNEISVWSPYPRSFSFNRMEYAGELAKIQAPPPATNIQINPYSLVSANSFKDGAEAVVRDYQFKAGGELKWVINPSVTADITVNTDFAQAEADVQVNNLSRFSVLFPEKRQFFLENASLFGPGLTSETNALGTLQILPFFSRRIGLSEQGAPLPIHGGIRLTGRSVIQNAGIMAVRQGAADTIAAVDYIVGRYSRNFGKQNRLGVIGTMKSVLGGHVNAVGGVDGFLRFDAKQSLNFMMLQSTGSHKNATGFGGFAQYNFTTNKIKAWLTESLLTKNFNPEMGFISRTDVISTAPGVVANLRGNYLPFKKYLRSYQPGISASILNQASTGTLIERELKITPFYLESQNGGYGSFSITKSYQNLLSDFKPLGVAIEAGAYHYLRWSLSAGSDASRKLSFNVQQDGGAYYNGTLQTTSLSVSLVPIPNISVQAGVNRNRFGSVGTDSGSKVISLYTVQGRFAINPRIQLIGLYQRRWEDHQDSFNIRFQWEFKPLSYIYLVLNGRETVTDSLVKQYGQKGIFKVSYLRQF